MNIYFPYEKYHLYRWYQWEQYLSLIHILELNGVTKQYKDFKLDNISFTVPQGSIVGLIGENGAGKSTTINAILDLIKKDSGTISILGEQNIEAVCKDNLGVVFDGNNYPDTLTPNQLGNVFKNIYSSWDNKTSVSYTHLLVLFYQKA